MKYGFQRLALLNSAGYQRAELPLDESVSLVAANNTGKTSLINALQFLLIINKRRMDFGANDFDKSRRFYFPNNSAYILLEVLLPDTGTVVLGCVGKGVSYDYEYFAYHGELNIEDYRLADGSLVAQPQLKTHFQQQDKLVFAYSAADFSDILYGKRKKRASHEPDFCVFKLEHSSQVDVFQRVLTRTLRLDRLSSSEVKEYLLSIFRRDMADATIDFKKEWESAFAEVNIERGHYQAAVKQQDDIQQLAKLQQQRLELRGKLVCFRPIINQHLAAWQSYFEQQQIVLTTQLNRLKEDIAQLLSRNSQLAAQQVISKQTLEQLQKLNARQALLAHKFTLLAGRTDLERQHCHAQQQLDQQTSLVQQAKSRSIEVIQRDQARDKRELAQVEQELATLANNLYQQLQQQLEPVQLDTLNRVFTRQVMTLSPEHYQLESHVLKSGLQDNSFSSHFNFLGLTLHLSGLEPQHSQRSAEELKQRVQELQHALNEHQQQLDVAHAMTAAEARKKQLAQEVRQLEQELQAFDEWIGLIENSAQRQLETTQVLQELAEVNHQLAHFSTHNQQLQTEQNELQQQKTQLQDKHQDISRQRNQRKDDAPLFADLHNVAHHPWLMSVEPLLENLSEHLSNYQNDCQALLRLEEQLKARLAELHAGGLTKYQHKYSAEKEIDKIIEFASMLPKEAEMIERHARTAVIGVSNGLRSLRDNLLSFQSKLKEFNSLISKRKISDLSHFKIETQVERELLEAVNLLATTAEKMDSGESFDLFNQGSVLDDETINNAKNCLIAEGEARGGLRIEHLFRLSFIVGKDNGQPEAFEDIDSAASNGTVLMAKLVTGLALLHLMQDKRHEVRAVCYLDEASALDVRNQKILIATADEFGFALIFASPTPLVTARYCVPISRHHGANHISQKSWQILHLKEAVLT